MDQVDIRPVEATTGSVAGGRYLLGRRLTGDRRRRVHEAWDVRLERTVALIIVTSADGTDRDPTLPASPATALHLHRPGLVELYDGGVHRSETFLVCQRVPGPTLEDRLPTMGAGELTDLVCRLIGTLAPLHRLGVAHGGLTPACILLGGVRPMIADWGVAAVIERWAGPPEDTRYRAPEQDRGETGPAADVHALGRLLLDGPGLRSRPGREVRALARRMTNPDPRTRPGVEEVAAALVGVGRESRPPSRWADLPPRVVGAVVAAAAAAGLVVGVGSVLPLIESSAGGASALVAPPERGAPTTATPPEARPPVSRLPASAGPSHRSSAFGEVSPVAAATLAGIPASAGAPAAGTTHPAPARTTTRSTASPTTASTTGRSTPRPSTSPATTPETTPETTPATEAAEPASRGSGAESTPNAPSPDGADDADDADGTGT